MEYLCGTEVLRIERDGNTWFITAPCNFKTPKIVAIINKLLTELERLEDN